MKRETTTTKNCKEGRMIEYTGTNEQSQAADLAKPTIIIACSKGKLDVPAFASDIYQGIMHTDLRCHSPSFKDKFNLVIMSAEHGFLTQKDVITPYDTELGVDVSVDAWVRKHRRSCSTILSLSTIHEIDRAGGLFVFLPKKYQEAFDKLLTYKPFKDQVKRFDSFYMCKGHRGIGVMRSRFKKLLLAKHDLPKIHFRSGVTSQGEFEGAVKAGQERGFSLADVKIEQAGNSSINTWLLRQIKLDLFNGHPVFFDNGIVKAIKNGHDINPTEVLIEFERLLDQVPAEYGKNLYFVLPDNPFDENAAVDVLQANKELIKKLALRAKAILPIHKSKDMPVLAHRLLSALDYCDVVLGVPCRHDAKLPNGETADLRLSTSQIESLYEMRDREGSPYFNEAHHLGLSEASKGGFIKSVDGAYKERIALADLHSIKFSCDVCIFQSFFGANDSKRLGSTLYRLNKDISKERAFDTSSIWTLFESTSKSVVLDLYEDLGSFNELEMDQALDSWDMHCQIYKKDLNVEGDCILEAFSSLLKSIKLEMANDFDSAKAYLMTLFKDRFILPSEVPSYDTMRANAINLIFRSSRTLLTAKPSHKFYNEIVSIKPLTSFDGLMMKARAIPPAVELEDSINRAGIANDTSGHDVVTYFKTYIESCLVSRSRIEDAQRESNDILDYLKASIPAGGRDLPAKAA